MWRTVGENTSFNGATAFQPWRQSSLSTAHGSARTWLQWGHGLSAVETRGLHSRGVIRREASMGPRPFSRGDPGAPRALRSASSRFNGATAFQPWRRRDLRHGRLRGRARFNGATAFQPWRLGALRWVTSPEEELQWGHGLSAVETIRNADASATKKVASMGPRPFSRGDMPNLA